MPQTDSQRLISAFKQNASQPIYRLSPELVGEIFLLARPEIVDESHNTYGEPMRYLIRITSITRHFRQIALDFGKLWSVVGLDLTENYDDRCRLMLDMLEAFLERGRRYDLHFWIADKLRYSTLVFCPGLVTLLKPHAGRVRTLYFYTDRGVHDVWEEFRALFNDAVNLNKLSLYAMNRPMLPFQVTNTLRKLKDLSLGGFVYDPSLQQTMEQVEILDLGRDDHGIDGLHQWLASSIKLKRLVLPNYAHGMLPSTGSKSLVRLEDLMYLHINFHLYHSITPWISLPNLRHLHFSSTLPETRIPLLHLEPKDHHYPHLRTLCIHLSPLRSYAAHQVVLIVMNPQLEYLEIYGMCHGPWVLYELSNWDQGFMLPDGAAPTFPGPCLKYLRVGVSDPRNLGHLSKFLSSVLSKDSQLKFTPMGRWRWSSALKRLEEQFPSQVKGHNGLALDKLYEARHGQLVTR